MQRQKILLTRRWPAEVERHLAERYDVTLTEADQPWSQDALRAAMTRYDALCPTVTDRGIDATVLGVAGARVRLLANYGAGFDHIDIEAARQAGIRVSNTPDVLTEATAELAVLLMLMVSRRVGEGERELRAGRWTGWRATHLVGQSVTGKTLGLIGFGRIAQATAQRARQGWGMTIAYHSRHRAEAAIEAETGARYVPALDDLIAESDVVSLHCPGGAETRHLIDRARLARMKPSAILINTARGSVVDEAALAEALADRRIMGAGLDVYAAEPQVHPALLALENVVLLPHLGSATAETRIAMGMRVAANLDRFFSGAPLLDPLW